MKFGMRISYNQYLVMDQATFNKLTEVLSKSEVRYQNGYGADALFTPDPMEIAIATIKEHQLVDVLPSVETAE
jgi:hypothetical protein